MAGIVLPALLPLLLDRARGTLTPSGEALLLLVTVVGAARIGGFVSALVAVVTAFLLLDRRFLPSVGTFSSHDIDDMLVLGAFVLVAGVGAVVVDRSLRLARRAAAEAGTLSALTGSAARGEHPVPALLARMLETFGAGSVELAGRPVDDPHASQVAVGDDAFLVLRRCVLHAAEHRLLAAFAAHVTATVERARLVEAATGAEPVKVAERTRTALLAAVGHDLRNPLAAGWAAVASLRSPDVDFTAAERDELLATADASMARLSRLVEDLLVMSRLHAGALTFTLRPTAWDEVLPTALGGLPEAGSRGIAQETEEAPLVLVDPPLLERVVAHPVADVVCHSLPGRPLLVGVSALSGRSELRVVDRGTGLPKAVRDRVFEPFQRLGDTDNTTGVGLGLALARGLTEGTGGTLTPEDTPPGGRTDHGGLPAPCGRPRPGHSTPVRGES
ncbi:ATP-binding protein [Streptomyces sp. NPDC012825]|uniref:sensor histidine kinase n=1 Tax=Streptomyces sp. NPDC012825 TaxID=3364851 RepID=UPI0036BE3D65